MKKLAPICNHNKGIVKVTDDRKSKPWTVEEKDRAIELQRNGYSLKGIASILNRPKSGVQAIVRESRKGKKV